MSLVVGALGAGVAGFLGNITATLTDGPQSLVERMASVTMPVGAVTGFVSCYVVSYYYLRFIASRGWLSGLSFGPLFGALTGALSGCITGAVRSFVEMGRFDTANFAFSGVFGAVVGGVLGLVVGFVLSITLGPWVPDKISGRSTGRQE